MNSFVTKVQGFTCFVKLKIIPMKKITFTCLLLLGFSLFGFSQSKQLKEKANEKVEQLNAEIIAGDETLALTENQKFQILTMHMDRIKKTKEARKEGKNNEEIKLINKKYFQKIYQEILTKDQVKARKKGKEK